MNEQEKDEQEKLEQPIIKKNSNRGLKMKRFLNRRSGEYIVEIQPKRKVRKNEETE
jgi:hypothetical protein